MSSKLPGFPYLKAIQHLQVFAFAFDTAKNQYYTHFTIVKGKTDDTDLQCCDPTERQMVDRLGIRDPWDQLPRTDEGGIAR